MRHWIIAAAVMPLLTACASNLVVSAPGCRESNDRLCGIPVFRPVIAVEAGFLRTHTPPQASGGDAATTTQCRPVGRFRIVQQSGDVPSYYVRPQNGLFANGEFTIKLNENGTLNTLTLNSTSQASEAIEATTSALTSLLPFAGVTAAVADDGGGPDTNAWAPNGSDPAPACNSGFRRERVYSLSEFTDAANAGRLNRYVHREP